MNLINTKGVDLTTPAQKVVAVGLMVGVFFLLNWILPPIVVILQNLWLTIILGLPILLGVLYIVFNPFAVWAIFKTLSWNLTKFFISQDILGTMERYYEYLVAKHDKLTLSRNKILAVEKELSRQMKDNKEKIDKTQQDYVFLESKGEKQENLKVLSNRLSVDTKIMEALIPRFQAVQQQRLYLDELEKLWGSDIQSLRYTLDAKAEEYNTYKKTAEALGEAKEFINGETEQGRIFKESLKQLEQNVTSYMANIESFESKAKPLIEQGRMNESLQEEDGRRIIEEYKQLQTFIK